MSQSSYALSVRESMGFDAMSPNPKSFIRCDSKFVFYGDFRTKKTAIKPIVRPKGIVRKYVRGWSIFFENRNLFLALLPSLASKFLVSLSFLVTFFIAHHFWRIRCYFYINSLSAPLAPKFLLPPKF